VMADNAEKYCRRCCSHAHAHTVTCVSTRYQKEVPPGGCECCHWPFGSVLRESLKSDMCCLCTFTSMMLLRFLLIPVCFMFLLPVSVAVAALHIIPAYCSFFHNIIIKSPRFGPVLKTVFAFGFIFIAALSPAAIMLPVAFTCIALPLSYAPGPVLRAVCVSPLQVCMRSCVRVCVYLRARARVRCLTCVPPLQLLTEGWKKKQMVYEHYATPGPYYEIKILNLLAAILSLLICLVLLPVGYLLIALCSAPRILGALCLWTWSEDGARSECWCLFWPCLTVMSIFAFFAPIANVMLAPIYGIGIAITDGFMVGWDTPEKICEYPWKRMKEYLDALNEWLAPKLQSS